MRCAAAAVLLLLPLTALPDERPYAFTYEPVVSAGGETELELYETLSQPRGGRAADRTWEHKLELGHGLTDRLSLSGYGVFRTTSATAFQLAALRVEGRYKLLTAAQAPVELVLYLEGEKEVVEDRPWGVEEKVILGRTDGRFGWALNLVAEQEFPAGGGLETRWGWSAGAAVRALEPLRVGVETFGARHRAAGGVVSWEAYAGPTAVLSLPTGRSPLATAWLIVGAAFGLDAASDRLLVRAVVGADF
jgi:hypothetical protein